MNANTLNLSAEDINNEAERKEKAIKLLLWLGQVSIGMLFAGLTSGYIVRRAAGNWLTFGMPTAFFISTAIILISSITMNMAVQAVKKNSIDAIPRFIVVTLVLGVAFGICQYFGWTALVKGNIYFTGTQSNAAGSFLYVITGLHLAHILGGLVALSITYFKAKSKRYSSSNYFGIKLCATYWHFLDGLWVYLFLFMLIMR
jgi:cytochrome c oxidase subunit 3